MNSKTKAVIGLLAFAAFIAAAVIAYNFLSGQTEAQTLPAQDQAGSERIPAPDFTVLDAEGNEVKLSDLTGKPVVLNFWASWCPPCKSEMPEFDGVYEELGGDVTFMMIDLVDGQRETMELGAEYVAEQGPGLLRHNRRGRGRLWRIGDPLDAFH